MPMSVTTKNICHLNHMYLLAVKEHALRNMADAATRYGVSVEFATAVMEMTQEELRAVSQSSNMLFRCPLTATDLKRLIRADDALRDILSVLATTNAIEHA